MTRIRFSLTDIEQESEVIELPYTLDGNPLGKIVHIPKALHNTFPFNSTAYDFLQFFRQEIFKYGVIEFPDLPVNRTNYTLAQRSPDEHRYSSNPYLTDYCQSPHQDTPPYPTAFWLDSPRQYSSTWIMSTNAVTNFMSFRQQHSNLSIDDVHKQLVQQTLKDGTGLLLNQKPGLLLIDNSQHRSLYHARTRNFDAIPNDNEALEDAPMYAFNEVGLLNYIDMLDERRGPDHRDATVLNNVKSFLEQEQLP